ncbi:MAG TPA: DUF72 domain-containing protein [Chryseosolibacter sp.]
MKIEVVKLGLSGIVLPYPKYQFPEEAQKSSRLTLYSTFFNSIEVNDSFYKIPQRKTIERWARSVPDNFMFTFKLHQDFTHAKMLSQRPGRTHEFVQTISLVGAKRGCILVQFPPSFKAGSRSYVENLLSELTTETAGNEWKIAIEFRDSAWYDEETLDLLKAFNASLVLQDIPKSAAPFISTSNDFVYVRFHGPTGNYRGSYNDSFLHEYAEHITAWAEDGKGLFVYFNNTAGSAFQNGQTLKRYLDLSEK